MRFLFFVLIASTFLFPGCGKKRESTHSTSGNITEAVYASGKIKARGQYQVFPTVSGILSKVWVKAGDTVVRNQPLFSMEDRSSELNSENARLALELSKTNSQTGSDKLQELQENIRLAKQKYLLDSNLFLRQKNLWDQKIGTRLEYDQRKLAFESSRSAWRTATNRWKQARIQLKNESERALVTFKQTRKQNADFEIRSQLTGIVYDVVKTEGDLVNPQIPLAVVGKQNDWYLELEVSENDITRIMPGQRVEVTLDGYRDQVFEAVISEIHPLLNERTRNFRVDALFRKTPPRIFPNMNVEANVVIRIKKQALLIPRKYLLSGNKVLLKNGDFKEVKVGLKDFQKVEVLAGLDTTQEIFLPK